MAASSDMASNLGASSLAMSVGNTLDAVLLTVVLTLSIFGWFVGVQFGEIGVP